MRTNGGIRLLVLTGILVSIFSGCDMFNYSELKSDPVLHGIEIHSLPAKTEYLLGEDIDLTGLHVKGRYSDGNDRTLEIKSEHISGFDNTSCGEQIVTVGVNGKTADFTVVVREALIGARILAFRFKNIEAAVTIDHAGKTVSAAVPFNTVITSLTPEITVSDGASVSPGPEASQDFSSPVVYTVTAEDGGEQQYTVTVTIRSQASITITGPKDEDIIFSGIPENGIVLSRSGKSSLPKTLTVSVSNTYTSCRWFINGEEKNGTGNTVTVNSAEYAIRRHTITVMVTMGSIPYSNTIPFTVAE
ncbi:bacterial Ig-like domain-containing protein [Breznakiella homolactica]|uniref:Bacterial Ig-like domain-containing protein n=1 Tax=Breznakiella homolactica TaxID=2798577 RepID=A0A7T8BC69_9SPIR|nr:bacterial Ig-like domain-containing protein [Breznakiella homolactica]QQO10835.1 bacterial Ig-like domain-containing protein [Breznakiella homolactica]